MPSFASVRADPLPASSTSSFLSFATFTSVLLHSIAVRCSTGTLFHVYSLGVGIDYDDLAHDAFIIAGAAFPRGGALVPPHRQRHLYKPSAELFPNPIPALAALDAGAEGTAERRARRTAGN